jgi:hypothetical protein
MKHPDPPRPADLQPEEEPVWQRLSAVGGEGCPGPDRILAAQSEVLPEESAREVLAHVARCASCRLLAADLAAWEGPELSPHEQEQIWRRVHGATAPAPVQGAARPVRRWAWPAAAAALFAVVVPAYVLLTGDPAPGPGSGGPSPRTPSPPAAVLALDKLTVRTPPGAAIVWRDGGATFEGDLRQALDAYETGDLVAAVRLLDALSVKFPQAPAPPLYLGVARLLQGRPVEATPALLAARARGGTFWAPHAEWYLAVASERAGDPRRAAELLRRLCRGDSEYAARACAAADALAAR